MDDSSGYYSKSIISCQYLKDTFSTFDNISSLKGLTVLKNICVVTETPRHVAFLFTISLFPQLEFTPADIIAQQTSILLLY